MRDTWGESVGGLQEVSVITNQQLVKKWGPQPFLSQDLNSVPNLGELRRCSQASYDNQSLGWHLDFSQEILSRGLTPLLPRPLPHGNHEVIKVYSELKNIRPLISQQWKVRLKGRVYT